MEDNRNKLQLQRLKAEQKAKSKKNDLLTSFVNKNSDKLEDKLNVIRVTHKADGGLFTTAIKKMMRRKK